MYQTGPSLISTLNLSVTHITKTYKPGCECCFSLNSLVVVGSLVGLRVTGCTSVPQNPIQSALGLLWGIPKNCPIDVLILDFSFPNVFVHAHMHLLGMIGKNVETSLLAEHRIPKLCIHILRTLDFSTSDKNMFQEICCACRQMVLQICFRIYKGVERCHRSREDYTD